jgi:hypothetical protein
MTFLRYISLFIPVNPEHHGMRSRGQLEIATLGSFSWMPYAPQGVKGLNDVDDPEHGAVPPLQWQ